MDLQHFGYKMEQFLTFIAPILGALAIVTAIVYGMLKFFAEYKGYRSDRQRKEEYISSFNDIMSQLSSQVETTQLSAAILLRRFFRMRIGDKLPLLKNETINVISALLRTLPTGILQKTIGDGLAYAKDLSGTDLQKTNLQDLYLGAKDCKVIMNNTDMYLADLSYSLIQNVVGHDVIFYHAILLNASIKDCDFINADFRESDLTHASFKNVLLSGAKFSGAINIPDEIAKHIDENGVYQGCDPINTQRISSRKKVFFSMPGVMCKEDELLTKEYQRELLSLGIEVDYYLPDEYPHAGQLNKVRHKIQESSAIIAFGFKQINVKSGQYRPQTSKEKEWKDKWLSTPWSEIEVGMGLMCGLPILLVKDDDIEEGVFDKNLSECFVSTISTTINSRKFIADKSFQHWLSKF